jgi:tetratricopeptide (TPR) repeat protein
MKCLTLFLTVVLWSGGGSLFSQSKDDHYSRAVYYSASGQYHRAIRQFSKYLKKNKTSRNAYWGRALAYYNCRKYFSAIRDYGYAVILDRENDTLYHDRGVAFYAIGDYKSAVSDFREAILISPDDTSYYESLIQALTKQKDTLQLIKAYNELIGLFPKGIYYYERAEIFYLKGNYTSAIVDFKNAKNALGDYGNATFFIGMSFLKAQKFDSALIYLSRSKELSSNSSGIIDYQLGICWAGLQDYKNSIKSFSDAILLDGKNGSYYYQRALVYITLEQFESACNDLRISQKLGVVEAKSLLGKYSCK